MALRGRRRLPRGVSAPTSRPLPREDPYVKRARDPVSSAPARQRLDEGAIGGEERRRAAARGAAAAGHAGAQLVPVPELGVHGDGHGAADVRDAGRRRGAASRLERGADGVEKE